MEREETERDFAEFWADFPRREARKDALKAWHQTAGVRPPLPVLLAKLREAAKALNWSPDRRQYIPLAATWLRGERWDDEFATTRTAAQQRDSEQADRRALALAEASQQAGEQRLRDLAARKAREQQARPRLAATNAAPRPVADLLGDLAGELRRKTA